MTSSRGEMGRKHEMFFKGFGLVIIVVKAIKSSA